DKQPVPIKGGPSPLAKFYQPKAGFANAYFNKVQVDRLWSAFTKHGDFKGLDGTWVWEGDIYFKKNRNSSPLRIEIGEDKGKDGKGNEPVSRMKVGAFPYELYPLKLKQDLAVLRLPETSGGLLLALHLYRELLTRGADAFKVQFTHGGHEPF